MSACRARWWLVAILALSCSGYALLAHQLQDWEQRPRLYGLVGLGLGAIYLAAVLLIRARPNLPRATTLIVIGAIGMRLITLGLPGGSGLDPSDDCARYLIEGVQLDAGQNPYAIAPGDAQARVLWQDLDIAPWLEDELNHPEWTAIYPPLVLASEWILTRIAVHPWAFKVMGFLCEAVLVILLILLLRTRGQATTWVVVYAWNPVGPLFLTGQGHQDGMQAALMLAGILAGLQARPLLANLGLSLACLVKPFSGVVLIADQHRRRWWWWALAAAIAGLAYLPFAHAGLGLVRSFGRFGSEAHWHGMVDPVLRYLLALVVPAHHVGVITAFALVALLIGGMVLSRQLLRRAGADDPLHLALVWYALLLACLPTLHPWYFAPLVALSTLVRHPALIVWTACATAYWLHAAVFPAEGVWVAVWWASALAHVPALAVLAWWGWRRGCANADRGAIA